MNPSRSPSPNEPSALVLLAIPLWMTVGLSTPWIIIGYATPMSLETSVPHLAALIFAVGWTALMTGTCRLMQRGMGKRSRWGFTFLMLGQLGMGFLAIIWLGFRMS